MNIPAARWLIGYRPAWLRSDAVAGLTAAAVVIPQALAYAAVAGLPVQVGLYTALAGMLVYPLLGSSRPLSVTTTSSIAMLTTTEIAALAATHAGLEPEAAAATLALLVGGALILARVLRLGFLANFISKPVLIGFQAGVGAAILVGQLKSVFGVRLTATSTLGILAQLPGALPRTHGLTLLVAGVGIAILLVAVRRAPRFPAPLIWVAATIVASAVFGLAALGVKTIGTVPAGLPTLALPDLSLVKLLWPSSLGIALMSFTEGTAGARTFRANDDPPVSTNSELVAVGAANLASAFVGGMPAGGGTSQTAVANGAGVHTQLAQWISAAAVLATLLVASRAIALLPQPALAAVMVVTAITMIKPATFYAIAAVRRDELMWSFATVVGVIALGTLYGVLVAVAISMLTLAYQANHPPVYAMAYNREKAIFRRAGEHKSDVTYAGLLMLRVEGRLSFANADNARDKIRDLVVSADPRVVVIECSGILDIEYTALLMLVDAERHMREAGCELWLAAINPGLLKIIERSPLGEALGKKRMFFNLDKALEAWLQLQGHPVPEPAAGAA